MVKRLHKPFEGFQTNAILDKQNVHYADTVLNLSNIATKKPSVDYLRNGKFCQNFVILSS